MLTWLLLQAGVAGPMLDKPRRAADAGSCTPSRPAAATDPADVPIVVCGGGPEQHRMRRLPERYSATPDALPRAETAILGGKAKVSADAEAAGVGGFVSNRAMVRLKMPF